MPSEIEQFKKDLLTSIPQLKKGEVARVTKVELPPTAMARASMGLSQAEFAALLGVSARTLQDWARTSRTNWGGQNAVESCGQVPKGTARVGGVSLTIMLRTDKILRLVVEIPGIAGARTDSSR